MKKQRHSVESWITAGFRALAAEGPQALKAEPLARALGTTKGSFYWHFEDVPAFRTAMLRYWEERAFNDIVSALDQIDDAKRRLRAVAKLAGAAPPDDVGGRSIEPAIRGWARSDPQVAEALEQIDKQREAYLHGLLKAVDLPNPALARLIYATYVGAEELAARDDHDPVQELETLIDLVLALS